MKMHIGHRGKYRSKTVSNAIIWAYYDTARMKGRFEYWVGWTLLNPTQQVKARIAKLNRPMRGWRKKWCAWRDHMDKVGDERGFKKTYEEDYEYE